MKYLALAIASPVLIILVVTALIVASAFVWMYVIFHVVDEFRNGWKE
jgi:hypothetical protein